MTQIRGEGGSGGAPSPISRSHIAAHAQGWHASTVIYHSPQHIRKVISNRTVCHMDSEDYIADLEETRTLRGWVAELEEELRQTREELRMALERKVEEVSVFVPPMRVGIVTRRD